MPELESVNLEHTNLRSFVLESLNEGDSNGNGSASDGRTEVKALQHLKEIRLAGNPLRCDCHARWLWAIVKKNAGGEKEEEEQVGVASENIRIELPKCATPFSVRNMELGDLKGNLRRRLF